MFASVRVAFLSSAAAAVALLTGCSGGALQTPAANGQGAATQSLGMRAPKVLTTHPTPFVNVAGVNALHGNETIIADAASATVTVWGRNGQLNAILFDGITANPNGMTTDAAEDLYVANIGYSNVIVYAKPYTSIKLTLDDPGQLPTDVAVSSTGVVAVMNYLTTALYPGSVSFYAKGSSTACATVGDPGWISFDNAAFDAAGNLFINGQDSTGKMLIGELVGGCSATTITTLTVGNVIASPGGVQEYRGKLLIDDPANREIYTYAPPSGGSLGSPTATTTLAGAINPVTFAIESNGRHLWTADLNASLPAAQRYTYPAGASVKEINDHITPIGIAVNPAPRP
jgi:hypothetical protein